MTVPVPVARVVPVPALRGRRVLIVTAYVPPTGGGGTIRVAKLVRHLAPLGWTADLIGWADAPATVDDPTLLDDLPPGTGVLLISTPLRRLESAVGASTRRRSGSRTRHWLGELRSMVHALTAVPDAWIGWALRVAALPRARLAPRGLPDALLTSGPPHAAHLAGVLLSRRLRVPLLMDLRDEWASNPAFRSRLALRRRLDETIESVCVRQASAVVMVSELSAERYRARFPGRRSRIHAIPNGFDPVDLDGLPAAPAAPAPGEPLLLGHIGSLRAPRDLRPLLEAVSRLREAGRVAPLRLVLAGDVDPDQLDAARAVFGDSLEVPGHVPHHDALRLMASCHVLLLVSHRLESGPSSLTGKIYEYLALRRPIVAMTPAGPGTRLIEEAGAGAWADPADPDGIERAVLGGIELCRSGTFAGAPDDLLARYDRRAQAAAWRDVLERAVAK